MYRAWVMLVVAGVVASVGSSTAIADFVGKDSSEFSWKYEMNSLPSDQDLDGNTVLDFTNATSNSALDGAGHLVLGEDWNGGYVGSGASGQIWPGNFNMATGYTVEVRIQMAATGNLTANRFGIQTAVDASNLHQPIVESYVMEGQTRWEDTVLDTQNNTDGFHVFRIAQAPGSATFSMWRDGVLLNNSLGSSFDYTGLDRLIVGNFSTSWQSQATLDYLRFTPGAYAPVPEPASFALLATGVIGLPAYAWRKRK
jgi:hypothetical protein